MRSRISIRMCVRPSVGPSVRRSVRHTRVEFPRNGPNSNKIASGIRKYAIWKTIQRQVRGQLARTHLLAELCSTCFPLLVICNTPSWCFSALVVGSWNMSLFSCNSYSLFILEKVSIQDEALDTAVGWMYADFLSCRRRTRR